MNLVIEELEEMLQGDCEEDFADQLRKAIELLETKNTLKERLKQCEGLLSEAHDLMDDVHCYDTEIYHEISRYFEGK